MADKYPYVLGSNTLIQLGEQLRKSFPTVVNADTLKKLGIPANSASYIINTLRFVGLVDGEGNKTNEAGIVFSKHQDSEFAQEFGGLVTSSYQELFSLHGDDAWTLDQSKLISFFRGADKSSAAVGRRQASTFQALAVLSGRIEPQQARSSTGAKNGASAPKARHSVTGRAVSQSLVSSRASATDKSTRDVGLTVRIEINLPAVADQETYDKIFKSIRENLINAE
jgi:hypothetical protein